MGSGDGSEVTGQLYLQFQQMWTGDCSLGYWSVLLTVSADGDWRWFRGYWSVKLTVSADGVWRWFRGYWSVILQFQQMGTGDCSLGNWSFILTVSADGDWSRFTRLLVICTYSFSRWGQKTIQRATGHLYLQFQQMGTGDDSEVTGQLYLQF